MISGPPPRIGICQAHEFLGGSGGGVRNATVSSPVGFREVCGAAGESQQRRERVPAHRRKPVVEERTALESAFPAKPMPITFQCIGYPQSYVTVTVIFGET